MRSTVIELKQVSKKYKLYKNKKERLLDSLSPFHKNMYTEFFAVQNIDLQVKKGEILGIVGKNGSGKSTLLKLICGILTPTQGTVYSEGKIIPLLELGAGFHPEFTGYENIYFYTIILGYPRDIIHDKLQEIIEFSELGEFIHQPIKTYSSGMKARLAFSVSILIKPDILILDEVLSVGDESFKEKSFNKMKEFFNSNKTIIFVSHTMPQINELCQRAIMLDKGELIMQGETEKVTEFYKKFWRSDQSVRQKFRKELKKNNI